MDTKSNANGVMSSSSVSADKRHPTSWAGAPLKGTWQDQCKHLSPARPKGQSSSIRDLAKQDDIARGVLPGSPSLPRSDGRGTPPIRPFASVSPQSPPLGGLSVDSPLADSAIRRVIHLESVVSSLQTEYATLKVQHDQLRQTHIQKSPPPPAAAAPPPPPPPPPPEDHIAAKEIEVLRNSNREAQQTIQNLRDELLAVNTRSADQLQELQSNLRQREEDRTDQSKLNEVVEQRNQAESVVETMVTTNAELEQQLVSKNEEIQSLQRTAAQTHQLQADLRRKEEEIAALQTTQRELQETNKRFEDQQRSSTAGDEEAKRLRDELQKNALETQALQQAKESEVFSLKNEVERLTQDLQKSEKTALENARETENLRQQTEQSRLKDDTTDELNNIKDALREASEQRDQAERVAECLLPQNESLETEVAELKEALFIAEQQREQAERCVEEYHQQIVADEDLVQKLQEAIATRDQAERAAEQMLERLVSLESQ